MEAANLSSPHEPSGLETKQIGRGSYDTVSVVWLFYTMAEGKNPKPVLSTEPHNSHAAERNKNAK